MKPAGEVHGQNEADLTRSQVLRRPGENFNFSAQVAAALWEVVVLLTPADHTRPIPEYPRAHITPITQTQTIEDTKSLKEKI